MSLPILRQVSVLDDVVAQHGAARAAGRQRRLVALTQWCAQLHISVYNF